MRDIEAGDLHLSEIDTVMGHPRGLAFLAMTEAWERFSFYGMQALLVLYLVQELLLPGHIENVAGMAAYRSVLESLFGPMSDQAFASQTMGLYSGFVYFTPLFGGLLADRWLGAKKTVMIGILLMTAGHFAMVFEFSVLLALLLLVLGSGCLKGNIAAQVGRLYPRREEGLRSRGYAIFSTGINIGAVAGPLACGLLAQVYGWHFGFGLAGVMMLVAAAVYFTGLRHFAPDRPAASQRESVALHAPEVRMIRLVIVIMLMSLCQSLAYDQMFNVGMLWIDGHVDLTTSLGPVPVAWFVSLDSFSSILSLPFLIALWRWQASRGSEPGDLGKIATGAVLMGMSGLVMATGAWFAGEGRTTIAFPLLAFMLSGLAFMYQWPTLLALVSRRAPQQANSVMMAGVYLTSFVSGVGSGYIARYYEPLGAWQFWLLIAGMSLSGALMVLATGPSIRRRLDRLDADAASPR